MKMVSLTDKEAWERCEIGTTADYIDMRYGFDPGREVALKTSVKRLGNHMQLTS